MWKNLILTDEEDLSFFSVLEEYAKYDWDEEHLQKIIKAYNLAKKLHSGVKRKSKEPYIIHPIEVARIAVSYHADCDTVCACLLHDVVEDTECTKEEIEKLFGSDVANMVFDVTKITNMDLSKHEKLAGNVRKLFKAMLYHDVRSIAVKLFDRLHNMRTMQYMPPHKQIQKSKETLEVYAPIAQALGANKIKKELQDLSLYYYRHDKYCEISEKLKEIELLCKDDVLEVKENIKEKLKREGIDSYINVRLKNIYNVFVSLEKGREYDGIHDLYALQIEVENIRQCYNSLMVIHQNYSYMPDKIKDYINQCKTTGYRALHTTITNGQEMIQTQIKTPQMTITNTCGMLSNLRSFTKEEYEDLKKHYPFFNKGQEIDRLYSNDEEFYDKLCYEVLGDQIYVQSASGKTYELPVGSTIIDFAFRECASRAPYMATASVNGKPCNFSTQLRNNDLVMFSSGENENISLAWADDCTTTMAKKRILDKLGRK